MVSVVEYLEKPVTAEEKEVAHLLGSLHQATLEGKSDLFDKLLADNAFLVTSSGIQKSKSEYIENLLRLATSLRQIRFRDVLIRVQNGHEGTISYICDFAVLSNNLRQLKERRLKCRKIDNVWRITEIYYLS